MRKKQNQNGVKVLIIGIILVCLVLGYYFYLSQRAASQKQENEVKITEVQNALLRNLDTNYPPTPREVLKCYCQMAQCLYNESYTEEEFEALALKIQTLYDAELVANMTQVLLGKVILYFYIKDRNTAFFHPGKISLAKG